MSYFFLHKIFQFYLIINESLTDMAPKQDVEINESLTDMAPKQDVGRC
jgi:hypothetical protein